MFLWRTGENYPRIITKYSSLTIPLLHLLMTMSAYGAVIVLPLLSHRSAIIISYFDSWQQTWNHILRLRAGRRGQISLSVRECDTMFPFKNQNNKFVILQSFFTTVCTLLQCFPMNSFAADIMRSKCLHAMSSNTPFCMHYIDNMNYCSLITVKFPLSSMSKR